MAGPRSVAPPLSDPEKVVILRFAVRGVRVLPRSFFSTLKLRVRDIYTLQCRVLLFCYSRPVQWPIGHPAGCDLSQAFRSIRRTWQSLNRDGLALKSGKLEMLHGVPEASPN